MIIDLIFAVIIKSIGVMVTAVHTEFTVDAQILIPLDASLKAVYLTACPVSDAAHCNILAGSSVSACSVAFYM